MTRQFIEDPSDRRWIEWVANHDIAAIAQEMGWRVVRPVPLDDPVVQQAWGIDVAMLAQAKVTSWGRRGTMHLMVLSDCRDRQHAMSVVEDVTRRRATAPLCWWWIHDDGITMWTYTPECYEVHLASRFMLMELHQWRALSWEHVIVEGAIDVYDAWCRHVTHVCQQEVLTHQFFASFVEAYTLLTSALIDGPSSEPVRQNMALTMLLRVLILYFLQARGALNRDDRFIWRRLMLATDQGTCFERHTMRPLCFGALNQAPQHRTPDVQSLGVFPFLNGGLFEPSELENQWPSARWDNDTWHKVLATAFEPYRFVLFEQDQGVDPEILGRVFEGVMASSTRRKTGTFYTPRPLVRSMVRRALVSHFLAHDIDEDEIHLLFEGDGGQCPAITREKMREALYGLTILDPAVGTGAFLIEALHQIRHLYETLLGQPTTFSSMRQWIHAHLYGVDLNGVAVRLCEVRLWLMLLSTMPVDVDCINAMEPLPNLSHRIVQGDSLLGLTARLQHRQSRSAQVWCRGDDSTRQHIRALSALRSAYLKAHGLIKVTIHRVIRRRERALMLSMIAQRRMAIHARSAPLIRYSEGVDLLGEPVVLTQTQQQELNTLNAQRAQLDQMEADLPSHLTQLSFEYAVCFPEVFASQGFDIVITNPPWVRTRDQCATDRGMYKALYDCASGQLWDGAASQGIRAPYGVQVDTSALFLERSLGLLKPGGVCVALVPSKLMRSLHGAALRRVLATHKLDYIEDLSESTHELFDAVAYPAVLGVRKQAAKPTIRRTPQPPDAPVRVVVWQGAQPISFERARQTFGAAPWHLSPSLSHTLCEDVLGVWPQLRPRRGVMTGRNDVFVVEPEHMAPWMAELSRPLMIGRDVREYDCAPSRRILWPYDAHGQVLTSLPGDALEYFERAASTLRKRRDHREKLPLWQLFRVHRDLMQPKVVWRDMGQVLEACAVDADVMVLNTAYYIAFESLWQSWAMSVYLNHPVIRRIARELAERARGGWRRHFAWVICLLPMPTSFAQILTCSDASSEPSHALWQLWAESDQRDHATAWLTRCLVGAPEHEDIRLGGHS